MADVERYGLTVAETALYCRCDDVESGAREVASLMEAAYSYVSHYINQPLEAVAVDGVIPADIALAIKMLVGLWYDNRGGISSGTVGLVPHTIDAMLTPYVILVKK